MTAAVVVNHRSVTDPKTGTVFEIEFLTAQQGIEKWFSPYIRNLERLGIKASIRLVDTSQYVNRLGEYDFDVVLGGPAQSVSPGNEQREYWGSEAADRPRSRNWSGIKNPVIDEIIEDLIRAPTRDDLVAHTRALDRVLLWNHYAVPELSVPVTRYAYWNRFGYPAVAFPPHRPASITHRRFRLATRDSSNWLLTGWCRDTARMSWSDRQCRYP